MNEKGQVVSSVKDVKPGERVKLSGFVENLRNKRTMCFIVLKDISGKMQVTIEKEKNEKKKKICDALTIESVLTVEGMAVANEYVKLNGIEVLPESMTIESLADALPIKEDSSIDLKLDYRWLDLRSEKNQLIYKVQTLVSQSFRELLISKGFLEIHSPKIIGTASESGSDVFEVKYFDTKAYLAQSPQFYKQMAMASGFEKVFEVGPVFRAEKSYTNKHATEFTGFDLEFSYINSYKDVMAMEEEMITYMLEKVVAKYGEDVERLVGVKLVVPTRPFPVMKLADVYKELEERYGFTVPESEKDDLTTEAERLCERMTKEKFGHEFLFIPDYSAKKRAFYHMS